MEKQRKKRQCVNYHDKDAVKDLFKNINTNQQDQNDNSRNDLNDYDDLIPKERTDG